ncbi:response regulator [Parapedobacter sp. GCM10030251]|uniref:response regulator n=1 Tax=Parapedobacter sp. GCM10030251 TaxID=3273419 RepID=UPI0036128BC1
MTPKLNRVIIADDHGIVRRGISNIIRENWSAVDVLEARTLEEALHCLQKPVDLLILDINLPGGNNVAMLDMVKRMQHTTKILIFSSYDEKIFAPRYIQAGANGYLNKISEEPDIIMAIKTVMEGRKYVSEQMKDGLLDTFLGNNEKNQDPMDLLSEREMEVVLYLSQGKGVLEISMIMNLKMGTVSTYKVRAFEKLGVNNIVELAEKLKLYATY